MVKPPFRLMFVARSQCGKTTLLIKLLHYYWLKQFSKIHIFCPTYAEDDKWSSLDKFIKSGQISIYPKVDLNTIQRIWNQCKKWKAEKKKLHTLLIFDDCTGQEDFCVNQNTNLLNILVCRANHANVSTVWSVQKYTQSSTTMRSQAEGLITFSCLQESEQKPLYQEFGTGSFAWFRKILDNTTGKPYHYLYINRQGPGIPDYYHNFKFISNK
jgi:ethanolamine utilization protein EutP (predicted NTPase)